MPREWRFRRRHLLVRTWHRVSAAWGRDVLLGLIEAALIVIAAPLFGISIDRASLLAIAVWTVTFVGLLAWNGASLLLRPHRHHQWEPFLDMTGDTDTFGLGLRSWHGQVFLANQFRCEVREPGDGVFDYVDQGMGPRHLVWVVYHPTNFPGCSNPPPSGRYEIVWSTRDTHGRWREVLRKSEEVPMR
jgi:hypothetical protein